MIKVPLLIFAFNRPEHFEKCLQSILRCHDLELVEIFVIIDGPRNKNDINDISKVHYIAKHLLHKKGNIIENEKNYGLYKSISKYVSKKVNEFGKVIVVEDDLIVAKNFIRYMIKALEYYKDNDQVMQISGFMYDLPNQDKHNRTRLLPITSTWGWATWRKSWKHFQDFNEVDVKNFLLDSSKKKSFNLDGIYDFTYLLRERLNGNNQSWGILWYFSVFHRNGLVIYPPSTLVNNIGHDGSGTHGRGILTGYSSSSKIDGKVDKDIIFSLTKNPNDYLYLKNAIWKLNGGSLGWLKSKILSIFLFLKQ